MAVIQGIEQLEAKLNKLPLALQRKVLTDAAKEGAEIIRQGAASAAPVLTGQLAANEIISTVASESNAYYVLLRIGPRRKNFYGIFEEFGTSHQQAEPWLGPSFETTKALAQQKVATAFKETVENL
jgi:HK97 gp10 family phage protein